MRIVILGAPGTGRNTQARRLAEKYGITHISTSDILSQAVKTDTRLGKQAKSAMDSGHLLADELMPDLIVERLAEADTADGFVLVGYPRTLAQALTLEQALAGMGKTLHMGVLLEMDQDALIQRLAGRWICGSCGQTFNIYTRPSKMDEQCDECGGDLHHRADDNEETIINRIRIFESQTRPVANYYKQKGHLRVVQGLGDLAVVVRAVTKVADEIDLKRPMPVVLEELPGNDHLSVEELEKRIMEKAMQAKTPDTSNAVDDDPGPFTESDHDDKKDAVKSIVSGTGQTGSGKKPAGKKKPAKKAVTSKAAVTKKKKSGSTGKAKVAKKAATKKPAPAKKAAVSKKTAQKKKVAAGKTSVTKKKTTAKKKKTVTKKTATKKKAVIKKKKAPAKKKAATKKSRPEKKKTVARKTPAPKKKTVVKKKKAAVKKKAPAKKKSTGKKGRKR